MSEWFIFPEGREFLDAFGKEFDLLDEDGLVRSISLETGNGDTVSLVCGALGKSICLKWYRDGLPVIDIFREGAIRISVDSRNSRTMLVIFFDSGSLAGELHVQVWPEFRIEDRLLVR